MLIEQYFAKLRERIDEIAAHPEPIQQAAKLCADALANGGMIHVFDSGHMISSELINRAGGLVAMSSLSFNLNVINVVKARADRSPEGGLSYAYIEHVFETNQLRPGDVLFVGSVSGKTPNVIELALQALGIEMIIQSDDVDRLTFQGIAAVVDHDRVAVAQ